MTIPGSELGSAPAAPGVAAPGPSPSGRPPAGPPPIPPELLLLRELFADHYRTTKIPPPPRFGKREFGFLFFDRPGMVRHLGMGSRAQLQQFLARRVPMHAYHSTAYYTSPGASTMPEKGWLGADLIFDLDADHLKNAHLLTFEQMLLSVKAMAQRLLDDFLIPDLGFGPDHVHVTFSGGRGYHLHVDDPSVQTLESHERREIVDYILGTELLEDRLLDRTAVEPAMERARPRREESYSIPDPSEGGWRRKVHDALIELLDAAAAAEGAEAGKGVEMVIAGISTRLPETPLKDVRALARHLFSGQYPNRPIDRARQELTLDFGKKEQTILIAFARAYYEVKTGETDVPVTSDIKRLIRLPGSLHGKTGLAVTHVALDALADFDPLRDAVALPMEGREITVQGTKEETIHLAGQEFRLRPAEDQALPVAAAAFALGRRIARLPTAGPRDQAQ